MLGCAAARRELDLDHRPLMARLHPPAAGAAAQDEVLISMLVAEHVLKVLLTFASPGAYHACAKVAARAGGSPNAFYCSWNRHACGGPLPRPFVGRRRR